MNRARIGWVVLFALANAGCSDVAAGPEPIAIGFAITVTWAGYHVADATYTLTVVGESGEVRTSRPLVASERGGVGGALAVTVPCDPADDPNGDGVATNTVTLVVEDFVRAGQSSEGAVARLFQPELSQRVACVADTLTAVAFTPALEMVGGNWVESVLPPDYFTCSAKLDCSQRDADGNETPILFLRDASGARARTLIIAFACTGGAATDPHLYLDHLVIDCGAAGTTTLATSGPSGRARGAAPPLVFDHVAYLGEETLSGLTKRYWNIAVGVATPAFPTDDVCTLHLLGAAAPRALTGGGWRVPDGTWSGIRWDVTLNTPPGDALTCGQNALFGGAVAFDTSAQPPFAGSYP